MRANERTDERVAQYLRLHSCLFQTTLQGSEDDQLTIDQRAKEGKTSTDAPKDAFRNVQNVSIDSNTVFDGFS